MRRALLKFLLPAISLLLLSFGNISCASTKASSEDVFVSKPESISYTRIYEDKGYLISRIYYPEIGVYKELNEKIHSIIDDDWTAFQAFAKENWDGISPSYNYEAESVVRSKYDIISVKLLIRTSVGNNEDVKIKVITLSYDKTKKKFLDITQVSGHTIDELSSMCNKVLKISLIEKKRNRLTEEQIADLEKRIDEATTPDPANFQCFALEGDYLAVYFNDLVPAKFSEDIAKAELYLN